MTRVLLIILSSIYFIGCTEFSQLVKCATLISHFRQHQEQNNKVTFFNFLAMHYGSIGDGTTADDSTDRQLPFKTHNTNMTTGFYCSMVNRFDASEPIKFVGKQIKVHFRLEEIVKQHPSKIFHPPQIGI